MDKAQEGELTEEEYNQLGEELAQELQNKSANIFSGSLHEGDPAYVGGYLQSVSCCGYSHCRQGPLAGSNA